MAQPSGSHLTGAAAAVGLLLTTRKPLAVAQHGGDRKYDAAEFLLCARRVRREGRPAQARRFLRWAQEARWQSLRYLSPARYPA